MTYDHDLKRSRWLALFLLVANLGAGVWNAFIGRWWLVGVGVNAAISCALLLRLFDSQQRTRDLTRAFDELLATFAYLRDTAPGEERYRRWGR